MHQRLILCVQKNLHQSEDLSHSSFKFSTYIQIIPIMFFSCNRLRPLVENVWCLEIHGVITFQNDLKFEFELLVKTPLYQMDPFLSDTNLRKNNNIPLRRDLDDLASSWRFSSNISFNCFWDSWYFLFSWKYCVMLTRCSYK